MTGRCESDEERRKREVTALKAKNEDSQVNVVKKVFQQPEVKRVVKFEINREMFISGLFMAFFLVGFFKVFDVLKVTLQYNWTIDLAIGVTLLLIGGIYTAKQVLQNKE